MYLVLINMFTGARIYTGMGGIFANLPAPQSAQHNPNFASGRCGISKNGLGESEVSHGKGESVKVAALCA